jgi:hypothetical protein
MRKPGGVGIVVALLLALLLAASAADSAAAPAPDAGLLEPVERVPAVGLVEPPGAVVPIGVEQLEPPSPLVRPAQPVNEPAIEGPQRPAGFAATANPVLRPGDPGWVGQRLAIPALGLNVALFPARPVDELFPPYAGAYIHSISSQPGRGTNSYIFAHAVQGLFLPLWHAQVGQEVLVQMSDGQVLRYVITRVVRDVPCPDPTKPKPANLPPALANATHCDTSWMMPTPSERLTLQTSQGVNRNYGELVIVAEPAW